MYPTKRVIFQIDGDLVAVMQLEWDSQKCYNCDSHHFELSTGWGRILPRIWKFQILPSNFGDA